jgi:hypothetical protein
MLVNGPLQVVCPQAPSGGLEPPTYGLEVRCSIQLSYEGKGLDCHPMGDPFERVKGIEPSPPAWKAGALPLSYTRKSLIVNDWSGWSDLNRRPPAPKAGTLPSCATARIVAQGNCSPSLSVVLFSVPLVRYVESMELE